MPIAWPISIFQSTFPLQGTTVPVLIYFQGENISIHVPIAGNDPAALHPQTHISISIHVPIAGNDLGKPEGTVRRWNFNPRSHCRERRINWRRGIHRVCISIHVPIAGNDGRQGPNESMKKISIHVPIAGNDNQCLLWPYQYLTFQSTFPLQGTTVTRYCVSPRFTFQSTFPLQGTTANLSNF